MTLMKTTVKFDYILILRERFFRQTRNETFLPISHTTRIDIKLPYPRFTGVSTQYS